MFENKPQQGISNNPLPELFQTQSKCHILDFSTLKINSKYQNQLRYEQSTTERDVPALIKNFKQLFF